MPLSDLPDNLRDALGAQLLEQLESGQVPEAVVNVMVDRILALPEAMREDACRELSGAATSATSMTRDTAVPISLSALLTVARTCADPSRYMAEIAAACTGMLGDTQGMAVVAYGDKMEHAHAIQDDKPQTLAAVFLATAAGFLAGAAAAYRVAAQDNPDGTTSALEMLGLDPANVTPGEMTPMLNLLIGPLDPSDEERDEFGAVVARTCGDRGLSRDVLADLADLPTTGDDDDR